MQEIEKSTFTELLLMLHIVGHLGCCVHCGLSSTQANGRFILTHVFQITETGKGKVENCTPALVSTPK